MFSKAAQARSNGCVCDFLFIGAVVGLIDFIRQMIIREDPLPPPEEGRDVNELAPRLKMSVDEMLVVEPNYFGFTVPKRNGGTRTIHVPAPTLKDWNGTRFAACFQDYPCLRQRTGFNRAIPLPHTPSFTRSAQLC